jgi:hypothetical protein
VVFIQDNGLQLASVTVKAAKLHKISRNNARWSIEQNLTNEIAAEVVYDFRVQRLDVANKRTQNEKLYDVYPSANTGCFTLIL